MESLSVAARVVLAVIATGIVLLRLIIEEL